MCGNSHCLGSKSIQYLSYLLSLWGCLLQFMEMQATNKSPWRHIPWMDLQTFAGGEWMLLLKTIKANAREQRFILHLCWRPGGISFRLLIGRGSDYQVAPRPTESPGQTHHTVLVGDLFPSHSSSSDLDNLLSGHYLVFGLCKRLQSISVLIWKSRHWFANLTHSSEYHEKFP